MPLSTKIGGHIRHIKDREAKFLMDDQVQNVYKKVESASIINVDTLNQEIELYKTDDANEEINQYHKIITSKAEKDDIIISQMEQWSIFSNIINYIQYNGHLRNL